MVCIFRMALFALVCGKLMAQGSLLMVGGGREDYNRWSDQPYGWFVTQADSGKIVNIDVDPVSDFYPEYFQWLGADTASMALQIPSRYAADDSATYYTLISAQGIFMEGGDQWDYVSTWRGTLVEDAIHYVFNNGGAIGGTSAGLAVLGQIVFDAQYGSAYPDVVAYDPYHATMHLRDNFLQILPDVLTDSHFHSRGRLGRLVPMLAREIQDEGRNNITGIGISDNTAFCMAPDMTGKVYGLGTVTFLYKNENSVINCQPSVPVTFTHINMDQLLHGAEYDLNARQLIDAGPHMEPADASVLSDVYAAASINGSEDSSAQLGNLYITNLTSHYLNAWRGNLTYAAGDTVIPNTIIMPKVWSESDYYENRIMGAMYGVAAHPYFAAVLLDDGCVPNVNESGIITSDNLLYILDTYGITHVGTNTASTNYCGLLGAKLHFLADSQQYDLNGHGPLLSLRQGKVQFPQEFTLLQNYPNPFNPSTTISFVLPEKAMVRIEVFNITGESLEVLFAGERGPGEHNIIWNASGLSSGLYLYRVSSGGFSQIKKCLLLK